MKVFRNSFGLKLVGCLGFIASAAGATIASNVDEYKELVSVLNVTGVQDCGVYCGTTFHAINSCSTSLSCCGWGQCDGDTFVRGRGTCCPEGHCSNGLQTTPPSRPLCN